MLTELRFANFKGFGGDHSVPLGRLTLVFGANSAGKSALIHMLLLLAQSVAVRENAQEPSDRAQVTYDGPLVDLGGFENAVYRHDTSSEMRLGLSDSRGESFDLGVRWAENLRTDVVADFVYKVAAHPNNDLALTADESGQWRLSSASGLDALVDMVVDQALVSPAGPESRALAVQLLQEGKYVASGLLPQIARPFRMLDQLKQQREASGPAGEYSFMSPEMTLFGVWHAWQAMLSDRADRHARELRSLQHLAPVRDLPRRAYVRLNARSAPTNYVGRSGAALTELLLLAPDATERVNRWLEALGLGYQVLPRQVVRGEPSEGTWASLLLKDERSDTVVSLADVGMGVSQVLPVLAQTLLAQHKILLIEQPELHLHPGAQSELGDLLISSLAQRNQLVVETHSEHLLLRLLRRVREGRLSADDLVVLHVDAQPGMGSVVRQLRVSGTGEFMDEWPGGFFEERIEELFGGSLGQ